MHAAFCDGKVRSEEFSQWLHEKWIQGNWACITPVELLNLPIQRRYEIDEVIGEIWSGVQSG